MISKAAEPSNKVRKYVYEIGDYTIGADEYLFMLGIAIGKIIIFIVFIHLMKVVIMSMIYQLHRLRIFWTELQK